MAVAVLTNEAVAVAVLTSETVTSAQTITGRTAIPISSPVVINGMRLAGVAPIPRVMICSAIYDAFTLRAIYVVRVMLVGDVALSRVSVKAVVDPFGFLTVTVVLETLFSVKNC